MPIADVLQPGAILRGKYRVERVLGSGGMGVVVLATHVRMAKLVAIKLLKPESRDLPDVVVRFAREARAASQLRGEHAVRILDVDDGDEGDPFLVMEYLEGSDLHDVLQKEGPLPVETAVAYALQVCEGIAEAHALGIIHRDIKPANLFLTTRADGSALVKILDFGISKATTPEAAGDHLVTKPQTAIGSPSYMSPEALKDSTEVDARTDIWSLGIVIHQLLTNALPFQATTTAALAARIVADPPRALRAERPEVPSELETLVLRCLAKSPADRFADVTELAHALAPLAPGGEAGASRIARVAIASAQRGPSSSRTSSPPPSLRGESGPAATPAPATASLHGVAPSPLQRAMVTEDGSSVVASATGDRPSRGPRASRGHLIAGLGAALLVAGGFWGVSRLASRGSSVVIAPPAPSPAPVVSTEPGGVDAAAAVAFADAAALDPTDRTTRADAGVRKVRPPSSAPASARSPAPKNPMDIDFR